MLVHINFHILLLITTDIYTCLCYMCTHIREYKDKVDRSIIKCLSITQMSLPLDPRPLDCISYEIAQSVRENFSLYLILFHFYY